MSRQIVLASHNAGKLREMRAQLTNYSLVALTDFDVEPAIEDGLSFVENAIIKARHACQHTDLPAIADDSGLEVDALNGAPGIYSARYAGEEASSDDNITKLLNALLTVPSSQRTARYQCVIAFMRHVDDPTPIICQGTWEGLILSERMGDGGFGYDPIFYVISQQCSAAQLSPDRKRQLSHRGQALAALCQQLG